jgi:hypothetical protein
MVLSFAMTALVDMDRTEITAPKFYCCRGPLPIDGWLVDLAVTAQWTMFIVYGWCV